MTREGLLPSDPVRFIQDCIRRGRVLWTYHVNMRLAGRFIPRESILAAVEALELVETYPDDKYLPSYRPQPSGRRATCVSQWTWTATMSASSLRTARTPVSGRTT